MSETLRDLVMSLSLQTDNFTRNIKSVGKQIQEAESRFKLAAAGVEGFDRTTTGLATQLSTLERRLSLQKDAVTQYQRALEAASNKLSECYNWQNDYAQRLEDAKTAQQALKEQVGAAQQVRTFSSTLGDSNSATIAAKANLDALKVEYRASVQEVKKLSGQNAALKKTTQNAADAVSQANTNLNMARAGVKPRRRRLPSAINPSVWRGRIGTPPGSPSTKAARRSPPSASRSGWQRAASSWRQQASGTWTPTPKGCLPS